jgi:hypothetical protein
MQLSYLVLQRVTQSPLQYCLNLVFSQLNECTGDFFKKKNLFGIVKRKHFFVYCITAANDCILPKLNKKPVLK